MTVKVPKECPSCGGEVAWTGWGSFTKRGIVNEVIMANLYCRDNCGWTDNGAGAGKNLRMFK